MPPISEQEALQALEYSRRVKDPAQLKRLGQLVSTYKAQQESAGQSLFPARQQQEMDQRKRVRNAFQDRETYGLDDSQRQKLSQAFVNDDEGKAGYFVDQFLAQEYQRPTKAIRPIRKQYRDEYATARWGKPVTSDQEFYTKLGADFDFEDGRDKLAIDSAIAGKSLQEAVAEFDFNSVESDQYKGREDDRKREFSAAYRNMKAAIMPLEYSAEQFVGELQKSMGVPGAEIDMESKDVKPDEWFLERVLDIPKDERGLFLDLIRARGGDGTPTEDKTLFQAMSERMGRQSGNMYQGIKLAGNLTAIDNLERHIVANGAPEGGLPEEFGFNAGGILQKATGLNVMSAGRSNSAKVPEKGSPEWDALPGSSKVALDRLQKEKDFALLYKQVNDIAIGVIDPAQSSNYYGKALLGVSSTVPNMVLMSAGPVGAMVNMAAYQGVQMSDMIERNPSMSIGQAQAASSVIGIAQGLSDLVPLQVIKGKTPFLANWLNKASITTKSVGTRFAARITAGTALEVGQEFTQDVLIPGAVEGIVKQFNEDFNDENFSERIGLFTSDESLSELIPTVVALSLIGVGAGSIRDFKGGAQLVGNYDLLLASGINESRASEIRSLVQSRDLDKAQVKLREALSDTDNKNKPSPEIVSNAAKRLVAKKIESLATIDKAQELGLMPEFAHVGGKYELRFKDGSTPRKFDTVQEAQDEQWRITDDANLRLHIADRSLIERFNRTLLDRQSNDVTYSNMAPTTGTAVELGIVSEEAALNREAIRKQSDEAVNLAQDADVETEFSEAQTAARIASDPSENSDLTDIILGMNSGAWADGVRRRTITLFRQSTPFTIIEEITEADAEIMIKSGHRDRLVSMLRGAEKYLDQPIFLEGKEDSQLTTGDIKEAYSDLTLAYFTMNNPETDTGGAFNSPKLQKNIRKVLDGDMGGPLTAYAHLIKAIYGRAENMSMLRDKGMLDPELESLLAQSVGMTEQHQFDKSVETEAATIKEEIESDFDLSNPETSAGADIDTMDDAPFSVIAGEETSFSTIALKEQDAAYLSAVESGDMEAAQAMVDDAAKGAGYDSPMVFHGTNHDFDAFSPKRKYGGSGDATLYLGDGIYFTDDFQTAETYADDEDSGRVVESYLKLSNPYTLEDESLTSPNNQGAFAARLGVPPSKIQAHLQEMGHDGIIIKDFNADPDESYGEYVVFHSNQIKSADPVTYDASGEVIPLSKRFDESRDEISFSTIQNPGDQVSAMFSPFQRSPKLRMKLGQEMQRRAGKLKQSLDSVFAANRSKKEINEARKNREGELIQEKLEALTPATIGALEASASLDDAAQRPILSELLTRKTYTRKDGKVVGYWSGSLMSKSRAKKAGKSVNEFDGIENLNLPPYIWGGSTMPDTAAADFGMDVTEFWDALSKEIDSYRSTLEATNEAQATIRELEKEARDEAKAFADELQNERDTVGTDRATLIAALRTLEAIKSALPAEVRGRVGGSVAMAQLKTPVAMLNEIEKRIEQINRELEKYLKKEADAQVKKLFKKTVPAKDEAGKLRKGKAGADIHSLFDQVTKVWKQGWSAERAEGHSLALEAEIAKGEMSGDKEANAMLEAEMVRMFGGWKEQDSASRVNAFEEAQEIWTQGYHAWKEKKAIEREKRDATRAELVKATKKKGTGGEKDIAEMTGVTFKGKAKEFALSLLNFDQLVSWTFGNNAQAKWFADSERTAENTKRDAITDVVESVENLFTEMGGSRYKGEQLQFEMSRKGTIQATDSLGDVRQLSELEAVTALLMWQQEDGQRHMKGKKDDDGNISSSWSYDAEFIDQISGNLSDNAWKVLTFLNQQYGGEYEGLNAIYKEIYGVNLPQNPNYSPLTMNPLQASGGQTVDPVTGTTSSGGSFTPGSLRRRGTAIAEPEFRDAIATFIGHKKQIEHWKAYAVFSRDAGAILKNRDVSNAAKAAHGQEATKLIGKWLDAFAQGGTRDAAAGMAMTSAFQKMIGNAQSMALVGRMGTLAIQATQLGAAAAKMPTGAYVVRLSKLLTGNMEWKAAFNSDYIQRRLKEMPVVVQQAMEGLKSGKPSHLKHQVRRIGQLIGGADALFTAGTYAMIYDYQISQGLDQESARLEADRVLDEIAQPTRMGARSLVEITATNPLMKLAWAFGSESRKNLALMVHQSANGTKGDAARAALYVVLINGLMASVIRTAWRDARDDEDDELLDEKLWSVKRMALNTSTDWLFGFPVVGENLQKLIFSAFGEYTFDGNLLDSTQDLATAPKKLITGESENVLRDVEKTLTAIGLFNDNAASAASLMHLVRDVYGLGENFLGD